MTLEAILDEVEDLHNVNTRLEGACAALVPPEPPMGWLYVRHDQDPARLRRLSELE